MKKQYPILILLVLSIVIITFSCSKSKTDEACKAWHEGTNCTKMTSKYIGKYTGGAGFCGKSYNYTVSENSSDDSRFNIKVIFYFSNDSSITDYEATLTDSKNFVVPIIDGVGQFVDANNMQWTYSFSGNSCTHMMTRIP